MYIDANTAVIEIQSFLNDLNFLSTNETIEKVEKPGEGNMNVVLRIQTDKRSFIVKQSRPFVQKYQEIAAPVERIEVEQKFYSSITNSVITKHIPNILAFYEKENTLILEDLGQCHDMSFIYNSRKIDDYKLKTLVNVLSAIHAMSVADSYPENKELRLLNHQHIFVLPFKKDNGFSLDSVQEGLEALSITYKKDTKLKQKIASIGERYLTKGNTLLHGDYYPGSWMVLDKNIYIIDPEFSFKGFVEFDLGVLAAHTIMATMNNSYLSKIKDIYSLDVDEKLLSQITGIEIMRRLIGLAQLPLNRTLDEKNSLLKTAYRLIM